MLTKRIIPCLDVRNNRVVKGIKFQDLKDSGDPQQLAAAYEQQGADELVVLDVGATVERRRTQLKTIANIRKVLSIPLTVGGGIRSLSDVGNLMESGADRVSINTAAVQNQGLVLQVANEFGSQCTVIAIDAVRTNSGKWQVVTHCGKTLTEMNVIHWAQKVEQLGAGEILLTSFDQDGTGQGYDLKLLEAICHAISIPVIASGGAAHPIHLFEALNAGAAAVLAASIFHEGRYSVDEVKQQLEKLGEAVRRC